MERDGGCVLPHARTHTHTHMHTHTHIWRENLIFRELQKPNHRDANIDSRGRRSDHVSVWGCSFWTATDGIRSFNSTFGKKRVRLFLPVSDARTDSASHVSAVVSVRSFVGRSSHMLHGSHHLFARSLSIPFSHILLSSRHKLFHLSWAPKRLLF